MIRMCIHLWDNNGLPWSHATLFCFCLSGKRMKWEHKEKSEYSSVSAWRLFFFFFYNGDNEDLGCDQSPVSLNEQTLTRSRLPVSAFLTFFVCFCVLFFTNLILLDRRLKGFVTCIQMHQTLHHDIISLSALHQISMHLSSNKQGQHQVQVNKWRLMRSLPSIPAFYTSSSLFLSPPYIPIFLSFFPP